MSSNHAIYAGGSRLALRKADPAIWRYPVIHRSAFLGMLGVAALAAPAAAAEVGNIFYIALENHNWTQPSTYTSTQAILGNPAAPFINSLVTPGNPNAAMVSYASNYTNVPVQAVG